MMETIQEILNFSVGKLTVGNIISALVIFLVCHAVIKALMGPIERLLDKLNVDLTLRGFLRTVIRVVLNFVAVCIVAESIGIPIASLLAVLGMLGLAVSLSVQGALSNLSNGIMLLITKFYMVLHNNRYVRDAMYGMLPMVVAGGLCIALSFAFGIEAFKEQGTLAAALMQIGGGSAFALMVPVLAGFIAFSIADRPGLTPGLIGGMLAVSTGSGFIGGIIAGFLAGYVAKLISSKLKLPQSMEALKPILIIPLISSLVVGLAMIYLIGKPVAGILEGLTHWLQTMGTANAVLLGAILGGMMCTDMGGPVNKAAYAFGVGLLSTQTYAPMAAIMAAGMVPPLALGLATIIARRKFDKAQQEGGKAALVLGLCFITEGAIPFAARDPMRVLPCCIVGGAVTGAISMAVGAKLMAPHGGLFVLLIPGAITPVLGYLLAIVAGTLVAGLSYAVLKRPEAEVVAKAA